MLQCDSVGHGIRFLAYGWRCASESRWCCGRKPLVPKAAGAASQPENSLLNRGVGASLHLAPAHCHDSTVLTLPCSLRYPCFLDARCAPLAMCAAVRGHRIPQESRVLGLAHVDLRLEQGDLNILPPPPHPRAAPPSHAPTLPPHLILPTALPISFHPTPHLHFTRLKPVSPHWAIAGSFLYGSAVVRPHHHVMDPARCS